MNNIEFSVEESNYPLHRSVYFNEADNLKRLLDEEKCHDCNAKDCYGNTPLHLAVMLGHSACIDHLLESGSCVDIENLCGWTPLDEAICRKHSSAYKMWCILQEDNQRKTERIFFENFLNHLPDFDCSLEWFLQSWIPFVSRFLPSDRCRVRKKGKKLRLDMSLKSFESLTWVRGNISLLLDGDRDFDAKCIFLDHDLKVFQVSTSQLAEVDSEKFQSEWNLITNAPVSAQRVRPDGFVCSAQSNGWFGSDVSKTEQIGSFSTRTFSLSNLVLDLKSRHEHVSEVAYNNSIMSMLSLIQPSLTAATQKTEKEAAEPAPPSPPPVSNRAALRRTVLPSWDTYCSGSLMGSHEFLGCVPVIKKKSCSLGCSVSIAEDIFFPLDVFLNLLNMPSGRYNLSALRHKLAETLPSGFPVRIASQVFPTVTARLTFTSVEYLKNPKFCYHNLEWGRCDCSSHVSSLIFTERQLDDDIFTIPPDYNPA